MASDIIKDKTIITLITANILEWLISSFRPMLRKKSTVKRELDYSRLGTIDT